MCNIQFKPILLYDTKTKQNYNPNDALKTLICSTSYVPAKFQSPTIRHS